MTAWTAAMLAVAATFLAVAAPPAQPGITGDPSGTTGGWWATPTARRSGLLAACGATIVVLDGTALALGLILLAGAAALARGVRETRRRQQLARRADHVLAGCEALAGDLAAGQPPLVALAAAAREWPSWHRLPVPRSWEATSRAPSGSSLRARAPGQLRVVAAAWQVAERTGAGLAGALELAAGNLREERAIRRLLLTEMAAARATSRMLLVLPVGVLLLGSGVGGDPVGFLLRTTPGLICLGGGLALVQLGALWLERIGESVHGRR